MDSTPESLVALLGREHATVPEVLLARAAATPDNTFLRCGDATFSFADAVALSRQFRKVVGRLGFSPGDRVASYLPNRPEWFWTWFGTHLGGGTNVPINRGHKGAVLADMVARSRAHVLVVDADGVSALPPADETSVLRLIVVGDDDTEGTAGQAHEEAVRLGYDPVDFAEVFATGEGAIEPLHPGAIANVMYTSGTTGRSKAVLVPHNQMCRGGARIVDIAAMTQQDVVHGWSPLFHLGAQQDALLPSLLVGSSYSLYPTFSLSSFWDEVRECGATIFGGFSALLELLWAQPASDLDAATSLRVGLIGLIPPHLHEGFEQRFGVRLMEVYGLTEAEPLALPCPGERTPIGSCGRPTPDFDVAVVDQHDHPVPAGCHGEIVARPRVPDVLLRGYEDDPDATVEAWRNLWFHTGDLGYFDEDGFLFFVDRVKHVIRRRGENISSWEVEGVIRQHPAVVDVVVIGVPADLGEEEVEAWIVLDPAQPVSAAEIHAFCRDRMARFMVPRYIVLVADLPYTETGKPRKTDLNDENELVWDAERSVTRG